MRYQYQDQTLTLAELRAAFPQVSFPLNPGPDDLAPLGVTLLPEPEPDPAEVLAEARASRLRTLGEAFALAEQQGHFGSSLGFEVDATERANRDVAGLIELLSSTGQAETLFCDYGNQMRAVTLASLKTLRLELIVHGQLLYARKWLLRGRIGAAQTLEDLEGIEITFDDLPAPTLPGGEGNAEEAAA